MNYSFYLRLFLFLLAVTGGCSRYRVSIQGVDLNLLNRSFSPQSLPRSKTPKAAEHNNLGVILEEGDNLSGAMAQYRLALKANPELTVAYVNAGNVSLKLNNFVGADYYYREALRLNPENTRALNNLAWLYLLKNEKIPEAIDLIRKAVSADSAHSYLYLDSLGWALYQNKEEEEAIRTLKTALEETPEEKTYLLSETHYHLGLICLKRGEKKKARSHLKKSLVLTNSPSRKDEIRSLLNSNKVPVAEFQ